MDDVIAAAVLALVVGGAYWRLRREVDFTDEAFYAVVTQRFALGSRPYVDEVNLRQSASLLTVPAYWAYLKLVGSTDGIILFLRHVYFALQCVVAFAVYGLTRTKAPRSYALLAAALPIAFVPFEIPACSYNTLGSLLFALGILVGLRHTASRPSTRMLAIAGILHGLSCIAYPPLGAAVVAGAVITWMTSRGQPAAIRRRWVLAYSAGVAGIGLAFVIALAPSIARGLPNALAYEAMFTSPRGLAKVGRILWALFRVAPLGPLFFVALAVVWRWRNRAAHLSTAIAAVLIGLVAAWFSHSVPFAGDLVPPNALTLHTAIFLGILSAFLLALSPRRTEAMELLVRGVIPSFVAGGFVVFASDNVGCMNAGLGLFTAATLCPAAAAMLVPSGETADDGRQPARPWAGGALLAALAAAPLAMLAVNITTTYRDGSVSGLSAEVHTGPYQGLFTTPERADKAEVLTREIRAFAKPGELMLVYYGLPAAYLQVPALPALQTSWTDSRAIIPPLLPYYDRRRTGEGLVVAVTGESGTSHVLEDLTLVPSRLLKDAGWFRIYREPPR